MNQDDWNFIIALCTGLAVVLAVQVVLFLVTSLMLSACEAFAGVCIAAVRYLLKRIRCG